MYKVEQKELSERVYESIKEMILKNQLVSGEKLNQEKLSLKLGVSRTPLLAAFSKLEKEMMVDLVPRRGAFVKKLSQKEFEDIFELRLRLEPLGAFEAASRRTPEEVRELKKRLKDFEKKVSGDYSKTIQEADYHFHMAIMSMSQNCLLHRIISSFNIVLISNLKGPLKKPAMSLAEHTEIYNEIECGNSEEAEKRMYEHIYDAKQNLLRCEI